VDVHVLTSKKRIKIALHAGGVRVRMFSGAGNFCEITGRCNRNAAVFAAIDDFVLWIRLNFDERQHCDLRIYSPGDITILNQHLFDFIFRAFWYAQEIRGRTFLVVGGKFAESGINSGV
jgi:hypothetical protein